MKQLFQITSAEPGKQCDFFPFNSLHEDKSKIHYFCEYKEVEANMWRYPCPDCNIKFPLNHPMMEYKKGDYCCVRCAGKRGINFENRDRYYAAVRAEILIELKQGL